MNNVRVTVEEYQGEKYILIEEHEWKSFIFIMNIFVYSSKIIGTKGKFAKEDMKFLLKTQLIMHCFNVFKKKESDICFRSLLSKILMEEEFTRHLNKYLNAKKEIKLFSGLTALHFLLSFHLTS